MAIEGANQPLESFFANCSKHILLFQLQMLTLSRHQFGNGAVEYLSIGRSPWEVKAANSSGLRGFLRVGYVAVIDLGGSDTVEEFFDFGN